MSNRSVPSAPNSFFESISKILFGSCPKREINCSAKPKRRLGFESLESRDLLSVSPLLPGMFHSSLPIFEYNMSAYVNENSNIETNNTFGTVGMSGNMTMLSQAEGDGMMD